MSKYQVGDRVKVRKGLRLGKKYDEGCLFTDSMNERIGCDGTIKEVRVYDKDRYVIKFDGDDCVDFFNYSNSMLEPLTLETGIKRVKIEMYYYGDHNCPYCDLDALGIKSLIIAEPYVIVGNLVNDKQYVSICHPDDKFDPIKGLDVCLSKRTLDELETMLKDKEEEMERIGNRIKTIKDNIKEEKEYLRKM